ncbi:hypothetical protein, partial [Photorhabdus khanii]|uniref:hypothetical protein n=1 Tax=Photorhabdus khanii TaxID=1004150 RepID=UPI0019618B93
ACLHTGKFVRGVNGQRQEPDDGRLSRPVPWERRGEVPLRDPITPMIVRFIIMMKGKLCPYTQSKPPFEMSAL